MYVSLAFDGPLMTVIVAGVFNGRGDGVPRDELTVLALPLVG